MERLKSWRDYVLKGDYYKDEKNSPAGLLHFHKLNICLIEAMCLIEVQETTLGSIRLSKSEQITLEQVTWRDYPNNLTQAELLNPLLVVDIFFQEYSLPQYREQLYQWLSYGLSAKAAREFVDTIDLVKVYENLQKLYSAAWLIHQRTTATPYLKVSRPMTNNANINEGGIISLYQLNTLVPPTEQAKISKIVGIIKHKVPTTQCVIYLGTIPDNTERIFLLVLTSREETATAQSLNCLIEDSCRDIGKVTALVHYTTAMLTALANNSRFFHHAIHCPVIYLSGDLILPTPKPLERIAAKESESFKWESWLSQGKDFLAGAEFYLRQDAANAALFPCTKVQSVF
ncbi:hypothetical protein DJ568_16770 [Mucilaginibacter hurinus]|uniref:Uncharacterized protein n=1 Tax=Mucilaginibacter hurinus TaxID=2201324 RepID=A0A367GJI1_9SPHI|nr:hypothetical protein DJ568_16770 [Mucilaginibacter hurinus]